MIVDLYQTVNLFELLSFAASSTGERNTLSLRYKMECKNEISDKNLLFSNPQNIPANRFLSHPQLLH